MCLIQLIERSISLMKLIFVATIILNYFRRQPEWKPNSQTRRLFPAKLNTRSTIPAGQMSTKGEWDDRTRPAFILLIKHEVNHTLFSSRTSVTSASIPKEDAYYRAWICVFSHAFKRILGLTHKGRVLQNISFGARDETKYIQTGRAKNRPWINEIIKNICNISSIKIHLGWLSS